MLHEKAPIGELANALNYDAPTGIFTWRSTRGNIFANSIAGSLDKNGYLVITYKKRRYFAHQLAFAFVYGKWADGSVDHKDLNPLNNRISNLRAATPTQQNANCGAKRGAGTKGTSGVKLADGTVRYKAQITAFGKTHYLGTFDTEAEASAAYFVKAVQFHGEFARAA